MGCLDDKTLGSLASGELAGPESERAGEHLRSCDRCRARLDSRRPVDPTLHRPPGPEGSEPTLLRASLSEPLGAEAGPALERGALVGRYLALQEIGSGGMGLVWAAYDPELDRRVALKFLRGASGDGEAAQLERARLRQEAKAIARLSHPNVVTVYDVGSHQDTLFIAMEMLAGGTVRQWLAQQRRTPREVARVFVDAGRGLAAAHAAGLVHRDFKPDNVLIGEDGRGRVSDFGLAQKREAGSSVVRSGGLVGTPAYMAPEQLEGRGANARSDQFSFCVSLWEALTGARPYPVAAQGGTVTACWDPPPPPDPELVPAWLRRPLSKGLAREPSERHASMEELLAQLEDRRRVSAWLPLAAGAAAALVVAGGLAWSRSRAQLCSGAEQALAQAYDEPRLEACRRAFLATSRPGAEATWAHVRESLERQARAFVEAHSEACAATRVRGEQSDELLDLRMACLERRRGELGSLLELFARADGEVVDHAVQAVAELTGLQLCANVEFLTAPVRPPPSPQAAAEVAQLRRRLDEVKALLDTGKYSDGLKAGEEAFARAEAVGYGPLQAEARFLRGMLQSRTGRIEEAEDSLFESLRAALAANTPQVAARAGTSLAYLMGWQRRERFEEAHRWLDVAGTALDKLGDQGAWRAEWHTTRGLVLGAQRLYAQAVAEHRKGLDLLQRARGNGYAEALAYNGMAYALMSAGQRAQALEAAQRAEALLVQHLGPRHDRTLGTRANVGTLLLWEGRFEEALKIYEDCLAVAAADFGDQVPVYADAAEHLGIAQADSGHCREAMAHFEQSLRTREKIYGLESSNVAATLDRMGLCAIRLGDLARAEAAYGRAAAIVQKLEGAGNTRLAAKLAGLAYVKAKRGDAAGVAELERAIALGEADQSAYGKVSVAQARFLLAQVLPAGQRAQAKALARQAVDALAAQGPRYGVERAEMERWLARQEGAPAGGAPGPG